MANSFAPSESTTLTEDRSAFQSALDQYIQSLPEKRQKGKFIVSCTSGGDRITTESINESIKRAEEKKASNSMIAKILTPVVNVLKDYDGVINSLVSADPMPTAIIWGALKVVIDGAHRFTNLFETIRTELGSLTSQLKRINEYEDLYGDSPIMQDLLCKSYINMLRFWSRVDKECDRCRFSAIRRAATSFSTNKLNKIISNLKYDADEIGKTAPIIEARRANGERQCSELERNKAGLERIGAQEERRAAQEWRVEQQNERHEEYYHKIRSWIGSLQSNETNSTRHSTNKKHRQDGTCDWLATHSVYTAWQNGTSPILWLHAPPGFGKSIICSHAIQLVQDSDPEAAVVYHFYQFDQTYSGCETLRILAGQLFECYGKRSNQIDKELYLKTHRRACSLENVQELISMLVKGLPRTYFFIDGLDEEATSARWPDASTVLDFLIQLSMASPDTVRVWYSSQSRPCISDKLQAYITFDIKDQVRNDVMLYLSRAMSRANPELDELGEEKDAVLEKLQNRAEGNFLWASLMIKALQEEANSLTDMKQFIERGLPEDLDGYYRRIFDRIEKPQRSLACIVFGLISFARRPLRMKELREAVGLLQSKTPQSPKTADMPFIPRLRKLFAPLIVQEECSEEDMDDCTCRLFHSTVREFLVRNPEILAQNLPITPRIIADACLRYLSQSRYAQLLTRSNAGWIDARRETVDQHIFLLYAAKYWDKHLDYISNNKELRTRTRASVRSFITSSNFQTCMQVQSLWVEGKFEVFCSLQDDARHTYLLRVFPAWFIPDAQDIWNSYRRFVHDWRHLLRCGNCSNPACPVLPYGGEVDRCWWAALGPQNFLSRLPGRFTSFLLQEEEDSNHGRKQGFEGVSPTGDEFKILRLHSRSKGTLKFICEHWSLPAYNRTPTLERKQTILAQENATNWLLYAANYSGESSTLRVGRAAPAMFSSDCQFLRIGAQLFTLDAQGAYVSMHGLSVENDAYPPYIEEFASCQPYTVLATRRNITAEDIYQSGIRDGRIEGFGAYFTKMEETVVSTFEWSDDADSNSESSCVSSTDSKDRAYETWSECSTEHSEDFQFEDDVVTPWAGPVDFEEGDTSESSQSSGVEVEDDSSDEDQSKESGSDLDSEDSDVPESAIFGYGRWHSDDEDYDLQGDETYHEQIALHPQPRGSGDLRVSLTVFDTSCSVPRKIFHLSRMVSSMLFASPPVLHPSKTLVVWPLGGGDVLFADFVANTYFVRKLRPSTSHTRHIFMKCHFSACGRYLHIASLEGQREPVSSSRRNVEQPPLKIALLLSTYRLCDLKTTKSPPTLIHRDKVGLGLRASLSVSKMPYTMTWAPEELYLTCSSNRLRVYRIRLFQNPDSSDKALGEPSVLMPKKAMFLPGTAWQREVHYFPPKEGSTLARIIVGSETRAQGDDMDEKFFGGLQDDLSPRMPNNVVGLKGHLSPPVGCYLEEKEDLGDWGKSEDHSELPENRGIGRLDRRREKFDPDDDCDLEPYIF